MMELLKVGRFPLVLAVALMGTFFPFAKAQPAAPIAPLIFPSPVPDETTHARLTGLWNPDVLFLPPITWPLSDEKLPALEFPEGVIKPLFFEGQPFNGAPTRVFAWVGIPSGASPSAKVPGIVLVHGGGGTAFRDWVERWVRRGYAAIAIDTEGHIPLSPHGVKPGHFRHEWSGPSSSDTFQKSHDPVENQWPWHAVGAIVRAHSLLQSLPEVDPGRTGVTGISWGGVWTELAAKLDPRFKFIAPVYASGFLGENSSFLERRFRNMPPDRVNRWLELWDPSQYLTSIHTPMLFITGANDTSFPADSWWKTVRLPKGPVTLSMKVKMRHGHPPEGDPKEITAFADSIVKGGDPLPRVTHFGYQSDQICVSWTASDISPVSVAQMIYTTDSGPWQKRNWITLAVPFTAAAVKASIPKNAVALYFNLHDSRGLVVSSGLWERNTP